MRHLSRLPAQHFAAHAERLAVLKRFKPGLMQAGPSTRRLVELCKDWDSVGFWVWRIWGLPDLLAVRTGTAKGCIAASRSNVDATLISLQPQAFARSGRKPDGAVFRVAAK